MPQAATAASVFTVRPDDPAAVHVDVPATQPADADHTALLQAALDRAAASPAGGIVLVPSGRYRVTRTLIVWRAVRLIGYGATRPVFVLPERTPGFQTGLGVMMHFTNARPGAGGPGGQGNPPRLPFPPPGFVPANESVPDANQTTFYSSMMNVDFEIGDGNPAAVAVRFHVAQHGILSDIDFRIGSGLAGIIEVGNVGQRLRFEGGRFGIMATSTSPFWPYTLIDSVFEGQREAAIREHQTGLTVVRTTFRNVPIGISIDKGYSDNLWLKDARFERVATAAVVFDQPQNALTQIGAEGVVCDNTPVFARERSTGRTAVGPSSAYRVRRFHHGLFVRGKDSTGRVDELYDAEPLTTAPAPLPPALPALPAMEQWINVRTLGVKGDGKTDDTKALQAAIDGTRALYFPSGTYVVRDTITLKPDSALIALHPATTRIDLADRLDAFAGVGEPKALLQAPQGGRTIVSGLGVFPGGTNPRATAILWMAGRESFLSDVMIHWSAQGPPGPGARARSGAQYPSVWVTKGGGGTFNSIWSAATNAQSGFYVSDTTTPGIVYELSAEHHLYGEIKLDRVENWEFHGPQTEEEVSSSPEAVAFEISDSKNITIANYRAYRVTRGYNPFPAAIRVYGSSGIRFRNVSVNAEHGYGVCDESGCGSKLRSGKFAFDNAVEDVTTGREVRERLFAVLDLNPALPASNRSDQSAVPVLKAAVEKLAGGFHSISGAAVDAAGTLYFADRHQQRIFSWSPSAHLKIVRDAPLDAVNLGVDRAGNVLVLSMAGRAGTVYAFRPDGPRDALTVLQPQARPAAPETTFLLPSTVWADGQFRSHLDLVTYEYETLAEMFTREVTTGPDKAYVSPDGTVALPAFRVFTQGPGGAYPGMDETGWRWSHALDTFSLVPARPGERVYLTSGAENRIYRGVVGADGTVWDTQAFAERGGESVVADRQGNVYVANGQIFVYRSTGELSGRIDVPERPTGLRFGGPDGRTLYVLTHHSLYRVQIR
ncbi:MAG: glycosyl hydrolase family 28-related protein [Vicinamibacteraceae bacterium]